MSRLATDWARLRSWGSTHSAELRLCVRSTTAAVLTFAAAQVLHLPIALWAVLTAVILTQISVGRSLKATTDYLTSTLGGAIDRKSTRLNSSHLGISYAVFCLK